MRQDCVFIVVIVVIIIHVIVVIVVVFIAVLLIIIIIKFFFEKNFVETQKDHIPAVSAAVEENTCRRSGQCSRCSSRVVRSVGPAAHLKPLPSGDGSLSLKCFRAFRYVGYVSDFVYVVCS